MRLTQQFDGLLESPFLFRLVTLSEVASSGDDDLSESDVNIVNDLLIHATGINYALSSSCLKDQGRYDMIAVSVTKAEDILMTKFEAHVSYPEVIKNTRALLKDLVDTAYQGVIRDNEPNTPAV